MKLRGEQKHIMKLIQRDRGADGWTAVSAALFPHISTNMPGELVEFEKLKGGGRARLTKAGMDVIAAMLWL